jgi:hypothetical protein
MNLKVVTVALLVGCLMLLLSMSVTGEENRRDGNWWRNETKVAQLNYIVGFFDGMVLGRNFSYWDFADKVDMWNCVQKVADSYREHESKYLKHVTNRQLVDGLDSFYADFRNRRIQIYGAVWLVLNEIAGTPKEKLESMVESWRRNVNQ